MGPHEDPSWMVMPCVSVATARRFGAPEAELDLPYGHMGQNTGYAMIAQRYAAQYGYDPLAMAKIAVDQRSNALPQPRTPCSSASPSAPRTCWPRKMVADPLHVLEIVMPVAGGARGDRRARQGTGLPRPVTGAR
jgi:acetyl-CoA acetyltransferase